MILVLRKSLARGFNPKFDGMSLSDVKVYPCLFSNKQLCSDIFRIRNEVFVHEQQVSREEEFDEFEDTSVHYLGTVDDTPAGTARWRITPQGIKLERFAVLGSMRNTGIGSMILKKVLADVQTIGLPIYLNAQIKAIPFYERQGFKKVGELFVEANIDHFKMVLDN